MSPITAEKASQSPLTSPDDVLERVSDLVGRACRRELWLLFIDEHDVQLPLLIPLEDYPPSPEEGNARLVAERTAQIVELAGAASVVVAWERRLGEASTPGDRAWARSLASAFRERGIALRGQYLSHRTGVRALLPAEYDPDGARGQDSASADADAAGPADDD